MASIYQGRFWGVMLVFLAAAALAAGGSAFAQTAPKSGAPACRSREASLTSPLADNVVRWRADQLRDGDGEFALEGNARFDFQGYAVCADQIVLDHKTSTFKAIGHVTVFEPNGNMIGAQWLMMTDAFAAAFIRAVAAHTKR